MLAGPSNELEVFDVLKYLLFHWRQFHNSAGKRIFDVRVEGALVVDDLDVFARVDKSPYVVETDPLPCLDGTLSIELVSQTENPILNAVEVIYDSPFQLKLETLEDLHKAVDDYLDGKLLIPINSLDVGALTNFSEAFSADRNPKAATFNENLDRWNMSNAESLWSFFKGAEAFNGDISTWNTARVRGGKKRIGLALFARCSLNVPFCRT